MGGGGILPCFGGGTSERKIWDSLEEGGGGRSMTVLEEERTGTWGGLGETTLSCSGEEGFSAERGGGAGFSEGGGAGGLPAARFVVEGERGAGLGGRIFGVTGGGCCFGLLGEEEEEVDPIDRSKVLALSLTLEALKGGESCDGISLAGCSSFGGGGGEDPGSFLGAGEGRGFFGGGAGWLGLSLRPLGITEGGGGFVAAGLLGQIGGGGVGDFPDVSPGMDLDRLSCLSRCFSHAGFSSLSASTSGGLGAVRGLGDGA